MPVVTFLPTEILDYVETHAPSEEFGSGISQRELAQALGYHPCSMSRPLAELVDEGFLRAKRAPVRGGLRKQLVYDLTETGRTRLQRSSRDIPLASGGVPSPPNPFYGRRDELRELTAYSNTAGGAVVTLDGPAGIGKSALVARHVRRTRGNGLPFWFTVRKGSSPRHLTVALAHALAALGGQQLAYYTQLPRPPVGREVADLVHRALGDRQLVAVIDDLHSASDDIRKFLADFIETLSRERTDRFYLIGQGAPSVRPAGWPVFQLIVGGLDRAAAHALTDRGGGLADRFESVYQASLGSPLLLQLAVSNPDIEASPIALPAAIVDRMAPEELRALLPLALANEALPEQFISEYGRLGMDRVTRFVHMGVVQQTTEGRLELLQVVRTSLLGKAAPGEEREAHIALATFYSRSRRPESVRERFLHLIAGEAWKVGAQMLQTQEKILLSLGYSESLRTSLRHLTLAMPAGPARIRALRAEAALLRVHSDYSESILALRRAISEAEGNQATITECQMQIVDLYVRLHQLDDARRIFQEARGHSVATRRLQILGQYTEGRIEEAEGRFPQARELFRQAFESSRRSRQQDLEIESVAAWSRVALIGGERAEVLRVVEEGITTARKVGRLDIVLNLSLIRARTHFELGQVGDAMGEMEAIRAEEEQHGYVNQLAYTLSGLAAMTAPEGLWPQCMSYAKQAVVLSERLGNEIVLGHTLAILSTAKQHQGMLAEARRDGERSVAILSRLPPSDSLVEAYSQLTDLYLEMGETGLARHQYQLALDLATRLGMGAWRERFEKGLGPRLEALAQSPRSSSTSLGSEPGT